MSDPVLTFVLLVSLFAAASAAHHFRTLANSWSDLSAAAAVGLGSGLVLLAFDAGSFSHPIAAGVILTVVAIYLRHVGEESEPADGMLAGAIAGAAATVPSVIFGRAEIGVFAECVLAGSVAGYGITLGALHAGQRAKQIVVDLVTVALAAAAASAPRFLAGTGVADRDVAVATAAAIPFLAVVSVFLRWPGVRAELADESALGFIDAEDVRPTAHPLLRLGRAGWTDRAAHRQFVRLANEIALRKRHQRARPEEVARLYQLEIIKLRMHLQEMTRIERLGRRGDENSGDDFPSDRMPA